MNKKRIIWFISILVMTLSISACISDDGNGDDGNGDTYNLGGQVYNANGSPYTGANKTFTSNVGGNGSIIGGKMSFSVGIPANKVPIATLFLDMGDFNMIFPHADYLPTDTMAQSLDFTIELINAYSIQTGTSLTQQEVFYIFVDKDCTVTATGIPSFTTDDGNTIIVRDMILNLKRGWNPIYYNYVVTSPNGQLALGVGELKTCNWILP